MDNRVRELIDATANLVASCSGSLHDETILGMNVRRARDAVAAIDPAIDFSQYRPA